MAELTIKLFGGVDINRAGQSVTGFKSRKAEAALAFLAHQARPFSREELAAIFWDSSPPEQALANLRKILSDLRSQLEPFLEIGRHEISLKAGSYWLDTAVFRQLSQDETTAPEEETVANWETAVALYQGDFLAGFYLRDSLAFDEWASLERERMRLKVSQLLRRLADYHFHGQQYETALGYAQQWLALDNLVEEAHRFLMRLHSRRERRNLALSQYAECVAVLEEELGVAPTAETTDRYRRIRVAPERPFHFPPIYSPFVGRKRELSQLSRQVDAPDGRLLTLIGVSGVGKTRLALQLSQDRCGDFSHGVHYIALPDEFPPPQTASDESPAQLLAAHIAAQLDCPLDGRQPATQQLLYFLHNKEMLLLLDNVTRPQAAASLIMAALERAPHIRFIVASDERLNLPQEWATPLHGLSPESDAVQLFLVKARQARPDFALTAENSAAVARICQLVGGLPLAIELAALTIRAFTPQEIAQQLENGLDFLASRSPDLPPRQRSLRAVFERVWQRLNPVEQAALTQIAAYKSSFDGATAVAPQNISLTHLDNLADMGLLVRMGDGRYQPIELIRLGMRID